MTPAAKRASFDEAPGNERSAVTEIVTEAPARGLAGLLDVDLSVLDGGDLPPLWHWVYLLERPASAEIGPDGHSVTGVPPPPGEGVKRMFAGGRISSYGLLRLGEEAIRRTWVTGTEIKEGHFGLLRFVGVRTEIVQFGRKIVVEDNDIVYLQDHSIVPAEVGTLDVTPPAFSDPVVRMRADEAALFRFSALTYNAHRIHFDLGWCAVEGYGGLVVHGPLQALLIGEHVRRHGGGLIGRRLDYRLVGPAIGTQVITAVPNRDQGGLKVVDTYGRTTATATVDTVDDSHVVSAHGVPI